MRLPARLRDLHLSPLIVRTRRSAPDADEDMSAIARALAAAAWPRRLEQLNVEPLVVCGSSSSGSEDDARPGGRGERVARGEWMPDCVDSFGGRGCARQIVDAPLPNASVRTDHFRLENCLAQSRVCYELAKYQAYS